MTPSDPFNLKLKTIEDHNRQAEQALAFFLRDFPQTYRLLAGSRFQVPVPRQADYMNYAHSIYGDAWTITGQPRAGQVVGSRVTGTLGAKLRASLRWSTNG
jgi:hypothetical protein